MKTAMKTTVILFLSLLLGLATAPCIVRQDGIRALKGNIWHTPSVTSTFMLR
jgi:hypothetical protein